MAREHGQRAQDIGNNLIPVRYQRFHQAAVGRAILAQRGSRLCQVLVKHGCQASLLRVGQGSRRLDPFYAELLQRQASKKGRSEPKGVDG